MKPLAMQDRNMSSLLKSLLSTLAVTPVRRHLHNPGARARKSRRRVAAIQWQPTTPLADLSIQPPGCLHLRVERPSWKGPVDVG
jgi:hypothetical protein